MLDADVGQHRRLGLVLVFLVRQRLVADLVQLQLADEPARRVAAQEELHVQLFLVIAVEGLQNVADVLLRDLQLDFPRPVLGAQPQDLVRRFDREVGPLLPEVAVEDRPLASG